MERGREPLVTDSKHAADSVFVAKSQKGYLARAALLDAALALIAEKGVSGFSIGELCTRAGLKRTSFYTYFQTVEELIDELSVREDSAYDAAIEARFDDLPNGLRRFAFTILYFFHLAEADDNVEWNRFAIEMLVEHQPTWERSAADLKDYLRAAIEKRELELALEDVDAFVTLVVAALVGTKDQLRRGSLAQGTGLKTVSLLLRAAGVKQSAAESILREWTQHMSGVS